MSQVAENKIENKREINEAPEKISPAKLNIWLRAILTLGSAVACYLMTATHFLISVRIAHFLGDVSYVPPSVLRYMGIIFQSGEVEASAQILFFVGWLVFVVVGCALLFFAAAPVFSIFVDFFTEDKSVKAAIDDCLEGGLVCIVPVLILSLLTLLIMPLESYHYASDSPSLAQIGEMMGFAEFLFTMTQDTFLIFLVCLFVVITCVTAYFLSFILPDDGGFFFFISMFIGVCVGIAAIFGLGHYGNIGYEYIKLRTNNPYLTHYLVFGIYTIACIALILPSTLKKKDKPTANAERMKELVNQQKKRNKSKKDRLKQKNEVIQPLTEV